MSGSQKLVKHQTPAWHHLVGGEAQTHPTGDQAFHFQEDKRTRWPPPSDRTMMQWGRGSGQSLWENSQVSWLPEGPVIPKLPRGHPYRKATINIFKHLHVNIGKCKDLLVKLRLYQRSFPSRSLSIWNQLQVHNRYQIKVGRTLSWPTRDVVKSPSFTTN